MLCLEFIPVLVERNGSGVEYLAIDSGGYVNEQCSRINCSIWLDASQISWDGVWLSTSTREVKCKVLWAILRIGYCYVRTYLYFITCMLKCNVMSRIVSSNSSPTVTSAVLPEKDIQACSVLLTINILWFWHLIYGLKDTCDLRQHPTSRIKLK